MSATTAIEGLIGEISIGGTLVALLTGVEFSGDRSQTPWRAMGTYNPTQILKGRRNFEGTARKAYLCGDWVDLFMVNQTDYAATIYPRGTAACGTIAGSLAIKSYRLTGMETESEAAVNHRSHKSYGRNRRDCFRLIRHNNALSLVYN